MTLGFDSSEYIGLYTLWLALVAFVWRYAAWRVAELLHHLAGEAVHAQRFDLAFQVYRGFLCVAWVPLVGYAAYHVTARADAGNLSLGLAIGAALPVVVSWLAVVRLWFKAMSYRSFETRGPLVGALFHSFYSTSRRRAFVSVVRSEAIVLLVLFVLFSFAPGLLRTATRIFRYPDIEAPLLRLIENAAPTEPDSPPMSEPVRDW